MKKIFILLCLFPLLIWGQVFEVTPRNGLVLGGLDLGELDTTRVEYMFRFPGVSGQNAGPWSAHFYWSNVDTVGSVDTIGRVYLQVTNYERRNWIDHPDTLDFYMLDTAGNEVINSDLWHWRYGRFVLDMNDTVAGGSLWLNIYFKPE